MSTGLPILTLSCHDRPGIVHAVSGVIADAGANIEESHQFHDTETDAFFMRVTIRTDVFDQLKTALKSVADKFEMTWAFDRLTPVKTVILVSTDGRCLNDLLHRYTSGTIPIEVTSVVSNHTSLSELASFHQVPFHHVPVSPNTKGTAEDRLLDIIRHDAADLVVLARYMQILSPTLCHALAGRAINIHHSFLPSFVGARPYHQAYDRGVKVIGATAHYVTSELDAGPIIEQDVAAVTHKDTPELLKLIGSDLESRALTRAVTWHAQRRVFIAGRRTIVFA